MRDSLEAQSFSNLMQSSINSFFKPLPQINADASSNASMIVQYVPPSAPPINADDGARASSSSSSSSSSSLINRNNQQYVVEINSSIKINGEKVNINVNNQAAPNNSDTVANAARPKRDASRIDAHINSVVPPVAHQSHNQSHLHALMTPFQQVVLSVLSRFLGHPPQLNSLLEAPLADCVHTPASLQPSPPPAETNATTTSAALPSIKAQQKDFLDGSSKRRKRVADGVSAAAAAAAASGAETAASKRHRPIAARLPVESQNLHRICFEHCEKPASRAVGAMLMCMTEQSACSRRRFHTECVKNHGWHIDQPFICAYYTYIYLFVMFLRCPLYFLLFYCIIYFAYAS